MITPPIGPLDVEEIKVVRMDFDKEIPAESVLVSAGIDVSMVKGVDGTPTALLVGLPVIDGPQRAVLQRVTGAGRTNGAIYHLRCRAVDDDGEAHVIAANLLVERL